MSQKYPQRNDLQPGEERFTNFYYHVPADRDGVVPNILTYMGNSSYILSDFVSSLHILEHTHTHTKKVVFRALTAYRGENPVRKAIFGTLQCSRF